MGVVEEEEVAKYTSKQQCKMYLNLGIVAKYIKLRKRRL